MIYFLYQDYQLRVLTSLALKCHRAALNAMISLFFFCNFSQRIEYFLTKMAGGGDQLAQLKKEINLLIQNSRLAVKSLKIFILL